MRRHSSCATILQACPLSGRQKLELHALTVIIIALLALSSLLSRRRFTHQNGIAAVGKLRIVDNPQFPDHDFFRPPVPPAKSIHDYHSVNHLRYYSNLPRRMRLLSYRLFGMPKPTPDQRET